MKNTGEFSTEKGDLLLKNRQKLYPSIGARLLLTQLLPEWSSSKMTSAALTFEKDAIVF